MPFLNSALSPRGTGRKSQIQSPEVPLGAREGTGALPPSLPICEPPPQDPTYSTSITPTPKGLVVWGGGDDPGQEVTKDGDEFRAGNQGSVTDDLGAVAHIISLP